MVNSPSPAPSPRRTRASTLAGYKTSLPKIVNAYIQVDHNDFGALKDHSIYRGIKKNKLTDRFSYVNKQRKADVKKYYEKVAEARLVISAYKEKEKKKKKASKKANDGKEEEDEDEEDDEEDDEEYVSASEHTPKATTAPKTKVTFAPSTKKPSALKDKTNMSSSTTTPAAIVSEADNNITVSEVLRRIKNSVVVKDNVFVTKAYSKPETDETGARYDRSYHFVSVLLFTKEDQEQVKTSWPSGPRTLRISHPNLIACFGPEWIDNAVDELTFKSPEAARHLQEIILSGCYKKSKTIDITFEEDMLQSITNLHLPKIELRDNSEITGMIVGYCFEVAYSRRTQTGVDDLSELMATARITKRTPGRRRNATPSKFTVK